MKHRARFSHPGLLTDLRGHLEVWIKDNGLTQHAFGIYGWEFDDGQKFHAR
jgi:hypothetical protein